MASKRRVRRKACEGKVKHPTEAAALGKAMQVKRRQGIDWYLGVYKCTFCGSWHWGHKRGGRL